MNNKVSFSEMIATSATPVLVDFWADWCQPCKAMTPVLEQLAGDYEGKLKVVKINVDKNPQAAASHGIQSIPTLLLYKSGKIVWRGIGAQSYQQLARQLQPFLN